MKRISQGRCEALRRSYLEDIQQFSAEDIVFIDESIFNEKTGWRYHGYAPVRDEARIQANIQHSSTWSICAAITINGWLPCTDIRKGYFKAEDFFKWLQDSLIPSLDAQGRPMVVILDNVAIHVRAEITEAVKRSGHLIRFLPPYSPDYNPIELTFAVLKAWIKKNWVFLRQACESFGEFLRFAIEASHCDRFARQQFQHAGGAGVYIEEKELIRFIRHIEKDEAINEI